MWKRSLKTYRFLLSSFRHLGIQRAHTLQYPSLLWTVFMYSSDGQLQHSEKNLELWLVSFSRSFTSLMVH
jgi:hypothetical protein